MSRQLVRRQSGSDEADINLTPMLDVVFIMLIFFIVTATFIKQTGVQVTKPDAETAEKKTYDFYVGCGKSEWRNLDRQKAGRGFSRSFAY